MTDFSVMTAKGIVENVLQAAGGPPFTVGFVPTMNGGPPDPIEKIASFAILLFTRRNILVIMALQWM